MSLHRDVSVIQVEAHPTNPLALSQTNNYLHGDDEYLGQKQNDYNDHHENENFTISPSSNLVIPQHLTYEEESRTFTCCDCDRFLTHCYFLFACCWFMLASSFARICALGDIISHVIVYIIEIAAGDAFFKALYDDWQNFQYRISCLDLLILSMFRTLACYWLYAYKRQLDKPVLWAAAMVMILSLIYCICKIFLVTKVGPRIVAIYSASYTLLEWIVYTILRRRRVLVEQNNRQLDLDVDIESGGFIYYNTHQQQSYQSPHVISSSQQSSQQYQTNNINKHNDDNLFTGLDALGSPTEQQQQTTPIPNENRNKSNNATFGARRHKSTQQMKIGGVARRPTATTPISPNSNTEFPTSNSSPINPLTQITNNNQQQSSSSSSSQQQQTTIIDGKTIINDDQHGVGGNIYSPSSHHAVVYPTQVPLPIQRLAHPNSQFLSFEDVRIHYKFIVNPKYQYYFDYLYSSTKDLSQSQSNLGQSLATMSTQLSSVPIPDDLQAHKIPPCLILIHGFIGTLFNFDHLSSLLQHYSAILIFDRPGFGLSSMLTEEHISFKEFKFRSQQQRAQNVQLEIQKLNQFMLEMNKNVNNQQPLDPFVGIAEDSTLNTSNTSNNTTNSTTTTTKVNIPPPQLMANVYDFYSLFQAYCPDFHPYRTEFIIRLIATFSHIYNLSHLGLVIGGHHSGSTLALSIAVEYNRIYNQINSNPLFQQFITPQSTTTTTTSTTTSKSQQLQQQQLSTQIIQSPIKGIILFSPSIYDDGFPPLVKNIFSTSLGKSMVKSLLNSECSEMALKRAFFNPDLIPLGLIKLHKALNKYIPNKEDALYTMAQTQCAPDGPMEQYTSHIIASLPTIEVPILVIHGEEDKIVPISATNRIIRALSNSSSIQCVRISECGHLSFEEAPETVAVSIDSFIQVQTRLKMYLYNNMNNNGKK